MPNNNFMMNTMTVKILANGLRKGGLLPESYFNHVEMTDKFKKAAQAMGFLPDEIHCQIQTDREYVARRDKEREKKLQSSGVINRSRKVMVNIA